MYCRNGVWSIVSVQDTGPGKVFTECEELIKKNLPLAGFDPIILQETLGWSAASNKKFALEKDMAVFLPKGIKTMKLGLGWDTKMDLDASVIMMDKNGNNACESVYYAHK
jgi:hypothetical protein